MTNYTLIYEKDQSFGSMGFRIKGSTIDADQYNMASEGYLIAHDILEHEKIENIGSIGDELKAMGAIWFIRGQFGDVTRKPSIFNAYEHVAGDVSRMAEPILFNHSDYGLPIPKVTRCEAIDDLSEIIKIVRSELKDILLADEEPKTPKVNAYLDAALAFMIAGYNGAKKRFARIGGANSANTLFWNISETIDHALKYIGEEQEGQRIVLSVNATKMSARWREATEAEYYY